MQENETVTQYIRRIYMNHKNYYGYSEADIARRAFVAPSTIYRVIIWADDNRLERWDSILNVLFAVGVDQAELRALNIVYREAIRRGVPVKRQSSTESRLPGEISTDSFKYLPEVRSAVESLEKEEG